MRCIVLITQLGPSTGFHRSVGIPLYLYHILSVGVGTNTGGPFIINALCLYVLVMKDPPEVNNHTKIYIKVWHSALSSVTMWSNHTKWTHLGVCLQKWGSHYYIILRILLTDGLYSIIC